MFFRTFSGSVRSISRFSLLDQVRVGGDDELRGPDRAGRLEDEVELVVRHEPREEELGARERHRLRDARTRAPSSAARWNISSDATQPERLGGHELEPLAAVVLAEEPELPLEPERSARRT